MARTAWSSLTQFRDPEGDWVGLVTDRSEATDEEARDE
jgi:hypothetical protein